MMGGEKDGRCQPPAFNGQHPLHFSADIARQQHGEIAKPRLENQAGVIGISPFR